MCGSPQVHVRVGLVLVQHHHVAVIGELDVRELAGRSLNDEGIGAPRHRQHDVEGLASMALLADVGTAELRGRLKTFWHKKIAK